MKRLLMVLLVVVMAVSATAQVDPDPNGIGVYFEPEAMTNLAAWLPFTQNNAYVCITRPTGDVAAVEFGYNLTVSPGMLVRTGEIYPATAVEASGNHAVPTAGENIIGFGSPLPATGSVVVMTWTFMLFANVPVDFYITGTSVPGLPGGEPAFVDGADLMMYRLQQSTGGPSMAVACVNQPNTPVTTESASFGKVKSLFR